MIQKEGAYAEIFIFLPSRGPPLFCFTPPPLRGMIGGMKTIEKELFFTIGYPLEHLGISRPLFLDIETTGLSPERSRVYLVGCLFPHTNECWGFRQWLTESPFEERRLLEQVSAFCRDFTGLVHFNGDRFDLPYLQKRCEEQGVSGPFLTLPSFDIYRNVKACRNLCALPNVKQKTVESFLGIDREDRYNGGQLIAVYHRFVRTGDPELQRLLLLHNEEDVLGMPRLLPMLLYPEFLSSPPIKLPQVLASTGKGAAENPLGLAEETEPELLLSFPLEVSLPRPFSFHLGGWYGSAREDRLRLRIPLQAGELRYYLPNYRDYYYLPEEDMAIHKSVAAYVDKDYRKKATPDTCYTKKSGVFLPLPPGMGQHTPEAGSPPTSEPVFRERRGGSGFLLYRDSLPDSLSFWKNYLAALCRSV